MTIDVSTLACLVCNAPFREGSHWRCQWRIHPEEMIRRITADFPIETRSKVASDLRLIFYGDRRKRYLTRPRESVGERAYLEKLHDDWWEDTGRDALLAAYPD